jgi:hypothetical protein
MVLVYGLGGSDMKVYMGPYKTWVGPYQIADWFKPVIGEARAYELGEWLSKTWLADFCAWVDKKRKRKINVRVDGYDVWGADHTLALIIHPVLIKLKEHKHGYPLVDDEDVPENIRSYNAPALSKDETDSGHTDEFAESRWDWVLDEMIWAFEQHTIEDWEEQYCTGKVDFQITDDGEFVQGPSHTFEMDHKGIKKHSERMANGRRLFAKYYDSLWD